MNLNRKPRNNGTPLRQFYRCVRCRMLFEESAAFVTHVNSHDWATGEAPGFARSFTNAVELPYCLPCGLVFQDGPSVPAASIYSLHLAERHGPGEALPNIIRRQRRSI